jgi:hypothetical protein
MKIRVDSDEYKCWHEVGHAVVCLHLGGDVDGIEFLDGDARGHAVAHCCDVTPEIERSVACGGFAAEVYLLKNGWAEQDSDDKRDINRIVFHNATNDREDFWGRKLSTDEAFSESEDRAFMNHAIGSDGYGGVVPIFNLYLPGMRELVRELFDRRRVEGKRVKELLQVGTVRCEDRPTWDTEISAEEWKGDVPNGFGDITEETSLVLRIALMATSEESNGTPHAEALRRTGLREFVCQKCGRLHWEIERPNPNAPTGPHRQ